MGKNTGQPLAACGFLLPNFLGFLAFTCFPVLFSLAMAFTNWSAKPAVELEYRGLRNFEKLLGFLPADETAPALLPWLYAGCAVLALAGLLGVVWGGMAHWRGAAVSGWFLAGAGLAAFAATVGLGWPHAVALCGLLAMAGGAVLGMRPTPGWLGRGLLPLAPFAAGLLGLLSLHGSMWRHFTPSDDRFWQYLYNTFYLMLAMPLGILLSLGAALLLNDSLSAGRWAGRLAGAALCLLCGAATFAVTYRAFGVDAGVVGALFWLLAAVGFLGDVVAFRTMFYLPQFTAGVALMILWKAMYNPETGPVNALLGPVLAWLGVEAAAPAWLASITWAKPAIMFMGLWTTAGGTNMLLYLAALSNVPRDLLDAAEVDGAGRWGRFAHVVWPQLAPTTFFVVVMSFIGGLQGGFEQARIMTGGGPAGSTTTLAFYIYTKAFTDLELGYAAAVSWVLFAVVFGATLMNWRFGRALEDA